MEPSKFDRAIRDSLNGHRYEGTQEEKERIWQTVNRQLEQRPSRTGWKVAALILLLLLPSYALWMQNRRQAATIRSLTLSLALAGSDRQPNVVRDTVFLQQPAITRIQTDTIKQIQIVKDTVVVYRPVELASEPPSHTGIPAGSVQTTSFRPETVQESQRAEFLLEPDHLSHRNRKKSERNFTFRFSLGASESGSDTPAGIQTRL